MYFIGDIGTIMAVFKTVKTSPPVSFFFQLDDIARILPQQEYEGSKAEPKTGFAKTLADDKNKEFDVILGGEDLSKEVEVNLRNAANLLGLTNCNFPHINNLKLEEFYFYGDIGVTSPILSYTPTINNSNSKLPLSFSIPVKGISGLHKSSSKKVRANITSKKILDLLAVKGKKKDVKIDDLLRGEFKSFVESNCEEYLSLEGNELKKIEFTRFLMLTESDLMAEFKYEKEGMPVYLLLPLPNLPEFSEVSAKNLDINYFKGASWLLAKNKEHVCSVQLKKQENMTKCARTLINDLKKIKKELNAGYIYPEKEHITINNVEFVGFSLVGALGSLMGVFMSVAEPKVLYLFPVQDIHTVGLSKKIEVKKVPTNEVARNLEETKGEYIKAVLKKNRKHTAPEMDEWFNTAKNYLKFANDTGTTNTGLVLENLKFEMFVFLADSGKLMAGLVHEPKVQGLRKKLPLMFSIPVWDLESIDKSEETKVVLEARPWVEKTLKEGGKIEPDKGIGLKYNMKQTFSYINCAPVQGGKFSRFSLLMDTGKLMVELMTEIEGVPLFLLFPLNELPRAEYKET